ncbi:MAG TPA: class I SAM-dependent methyltransferase [Gemmataceae bacterium]|jgi:SAM-dependent methyltransferase|nr:class I SAM-dependent methyltransferase [Gemmataceae bacterium]
MDTSGYRAERCDLCGAEGAHVLAHLATGRSLRSDRKIVAGDLLKLRCRRCGLVREGHSRHGGELVDYYTNEYDVAPADYTFYLPGGPVARSTLFREWITTAFGLHRWRTIRRCLEVGAGAGALLAEFQRQFPECVFAGVELCESQAAKARQRGLNVRQGPLRESADDFYDAIYSVAVLEHVPSPTQFLQDLRLCLRPGGLLFLCQPTQDVPSYDVFFVDHLHHFGTEHLRKYARKCGFRELGFVVGQEWMPNFSLHLWQAANASTDQQWHGPSAETACAEVVGQVTADMGRLDRTLDRLAAARRRVAVFGLNEVYALARAYSGLGHFPIACGLDDRPDNPDLSGLGFPVVAPEACREHHIDDIVLAVNKVYHRQLFQRLARLGVEVHPVLN